MPNTSTCLVPVLPTYEDVVKAFSHIKLPQLPTLPNPMFGNIHIPEVELQHWIAEVQNLFYGGFVMAVIKPLCSLLSIELKKIIPKIPGLPDITILDFIEGNVKKIKDAIMYAIKNGVQEFLSMFPPLFHQLTMIEVAIAHMMQMTFSMAIKGVIDVIVSLVQPVTDFVNNLGAQIAAIKIPTIPDLNKIANDITTNIKNKIASLSFPGFPTITIPSFGKIIAPALQAVKAMPTIFISLLIGMLQPIVKFINDIASFIGGFVWPKLCIDPVRGFYIG